jgi:pimeloyl-ACP methyl ester carboxylesterase
LQTHYTRVISSVHQLHSSIHTMTASLGNNDHAKIASGVLHEQVHLEVNDFALDVALLRRGGSLAPVLFLHGFGSTKEDYNDFAYHPGFKDRSFIAYDAPGCGDTVSSDLTEDTIHFQVAVAEALLEHFDVKAFHLQGHSMGGLTALTLAHRNPHRVLSFINIKGNLAPEDCFFSRQIVLHPSDDPEVFFSAFVDRTRASNYFGSALYAATLRHKVQLAAVRPIFESMVDLSDNGELMAKFLAVPFPRMYMYGSQYSNLSYLKHIAAEGVELAEITEAGHFPMYSNPVEMWRRIADFLDLSEKTSGNEKGTRTSEI